MHESHSRTDQIRCSSMELKQNVRFGVDTGPKGDIPSNIDSMHELSCALYVFSLSHGALFVLQ